MLNFRTIWVYFMFLLLIVVANGQDTTSAITNLRNHYYTKCRENSRDPEKDFGNLDMHFTDFSKYFEYTFSLIPDRKNIFCDSETRQLENRIVTVSKDLELCLSKREEFLPDFIKTSFKKFTQFLCHNNGENIDALFNSRGQTCLSDLQADNSGELQNCFARIFPPGSNHQVTKKDICDNIDVMRKCFSRILDRKCSNYRRMQALNENFFDAVSKPCSGCVVPSLSTLLAIFALLSYMFVH